MNSFVNRMGSKQALAKHIFPLFKDHKTYIEPFFGAGGMFLNKPPASMNVLNDLDSNISNLFFVFLNKFDKLIEVIEMIPIHSEIFEHFQNKEQEDDVMKAVSFLYLSNFSLYSEGSTIRYNSKKNLIEKINRAKMIFKELNILFFNKDFRDFFEAIDKKLLKKAFIYCDPPYLGTKSNYKKFKESDFIDLINCCYKTGCYFAISEFYSEKIEKIAKDSDLELHFIKKRFVLAKRYSHEILLTNYKISNNSLFS